MTRRHRSRSPRVLCLSFYFPPSRASGVYRARATANYLAAHGWDVTVFAAPLKFLHETIGSVDEELAATVDPRIRVERPFQSQFVWESNLRRFSRFRRSMPVLARTLYNYGFRAFPEHYGSWGLAAVAKGLLLHTRRPFDVVLATGNPFASFAAAWLLHRIAGLRYIVDYRDSWTLDLFTDEPAFPEGHPAWAWERRVLQGASTAVFVNEALRDWHATRYPWMAERMMVVPNGWDPDLLTPEDMDSFNAARGEHEPLRFAYVGTLSTAQPVEEMVDAFERARSYSELHDAELNIYGHLGFFKSGRSMLVERLGLDRISASERAARGVDSRIRYRGPLSKTEIARAYLDSDVLVFLAGGARYVTSGKIFEYMASGRPIVSVHTPGIAAAEVLDGYPLWFNANSLDADEVAKSMVAAGRAARDLSPELRAAALRHANAYTRDAVLAPLEARLRSLVKHAGTPSR